MKYVRGPVDDLLTIDGDTAVLMGDRVLLLSPLAAHLYELCSTPTAVEELAVSLGAVFGPPKDVDLRTATQITVDHLVAQRLLRAQTTGSRNPEATR